LRSRLNAIPTFHLTDICTKPEELLLWEHQLWFCELVSVVVSLVLDDALETQIALLLILFTPSSVHPICSPLLDTPGCPTLLILEPATPSLPAGIERRKNPKR
jgi:hypothetical protein